MPRNILEYLEATVREVPEKLAFADGENHLTFRQTHDQARAIGSFLNHRGFSGKPVVVFMKRHPRTIAAFLGAVYAGSYYVPLDAEMPRQRMELILSSLENCVILCDESTETTAKELGREVYRYGDAAFGIIDEAALGAIRQNQLDIDPIYIVFTSGSTGIPKGVMGCHRSVIDYIENLVPVLRCSRDTVFGNQTPLYFDACLKEIIPTLKFGATTYLIPKDKFLFPIKLIEYLNEHRINTLCWVVSALTMISSLGALSKRVPVHVHTIAFASEVFPIRQLNLWRRALPQTRFLNLYGPTETTGICCYYEVDREFSEEERLPIGKPFPNTGILLLDENDRSAREGEICIRGTRLTLGYYRDPERTTECFVQNPLNTLYEEKIYRTGDIGAYNDRGELVFLSRKDHQIKHMGHRIELGEIELAASASAFVQSACCTYDSETKRIVLNYVGSIAPADLTAYLRERLPRYMMPASLRRLSAMPLTPNGKLDRKRLKEEI